MTDELVARFLAMALTDSERVEVIQELAVHKGPSWTEEGRHPAVAGLSATRRLRLSESLFRGNVRDLTREESRLLSNARAALIDPRDAFYARRYPEDN
jgi:hypothetical protein